MCEHDKIQVIREGRSYIWSCMLCGDEMVVWDKKVWSTLGLDALEQGEGFRFRITERESERVELQA